MYRKLSICLYTLAFLSFISFYFLQNGNGRSWLARLIHEQPNTSFGRQLLPRHFRALPLGCIRPTEDSWLDHELRTSANGLAGHLWDFYAFVKDSTWLGGNAERGEYSPLNEGFPYWFNGLVALAYSLRDGSEAERLKSQVHVAAESVLNAQAEDGWFGPETLDSHRRILWGRFPFLLGLAGLVEANATEWEARIVPALWRYVGLTHKMLNDGGKGYIHQGPNDAIKPHDYSYGRVRVADLLIVLQWLLERNPVTQHKLLSWEVMDNAYNLSLTWEAWYNDAVYIKDDLYRVSSDFTEANYAYVHGVNIAQGLKTPAVVYRFTHNDSLLETSSDAVDWTLRYHGTASGTILADERIAGLSPYTGSELCTTVELLYSLTQIYQILGNSALANRIELVAYNALPSMLMEDHWAHQYITQPNQPWSKNLSASPFFDTNSQSQTFGLEPHYPCCTVNHPQGLPKFLAGSWVEFGPNGLAHVLLGPGTVNYNGIYVECRTNYPFEDTLFYTIETTKQFRLYLRVPGWSGTNLVTTKDGNRVDVSHVSGEHLNEISINPGRTLLSYTVESLLRTEQRANDTVAVYKGAVLYALQIVHDRQSGTPKAYNQSKYPEDHAPPQARDWKLTNTSPWNIAIDPSTLLHHSNDDNISQHIWAGGDSQIFITASGCEIEWSLFQDVVPGPPPPLEDRKCLGEPSTVRLVPLGGAKLHMAELPIIDSG